MPEKFWETWFGPEYFGDDYGMDVERMLAEGRWIARNYLIALRRGDLADAIGWASRPVSDREYPELPVPVGDDFDQCVDGALFDITERFDPVVALPRGDAGKALLQRLNDFITNIMQEFPRR